MGPGAIAKLEAFAAARDIPVGEALPLADEAPGLPPNQRAAIAEVAALIGDVRAGAEAGMPLDRLIEQVLERSGLRDALVREGTFEAQGRVENLDEMVRVAAEYEAGGEEVTLAGFLEGVALQADADLVDESAGAVTLMTIHNAKGLEFDTVLITGLEEGLFPHVRSDTPEALEEERRLFYVGLTRARRTLVLTHAESRAMHGGRDYRLPSRFLGEVPPDALAEPPGARRATPSFGAGAAGPPVARPVARHRRQRAARDVRRGRGHGDRERRRPGAGAVRPGRRRAPPDGRRRPDEKGVLMAATIIDGRAAAAELRAEVAAGRGRLPRAPRPRARAWSACRWATTRRPRSTRRARRRPPRRRG